MNIHTNPIDHLQAALKELQDDHRKKLRNQGKSYGSKKIQKQSEAVITAYSDAIDALKKAAVPKRKKSNKEIMKKRLEKARKLYPSGTSFTSLWGMPCIVSSKKNIHFIEDKEIVVQDTKGCYRTIYMEGEWATIHPKIK